MRWCPQFFDLIDEFSYVLAFMVFFGLIYRVVGTTMYQARVWCRGVC